MSAHHQLVSSVTVSVRHSLYYQRAKHGKVNTKSRHLKISGAGLWTCNKGDLQNGDCERSDHPCSDV